MTIVVLIVAYVSELVCAAARWMVPSRSTWVRSAVRISTCGAFWLLVLAGIIPWSFRWYALAVTLSVHALRGAWVLYRERTALHTQQATPRARIVLRVGASWLLTAIVIAPALVFPPYSLPEVTGRYTVTRARYTFVDENRGEAFAAGNTHRRVNVEFWYPLSVEGVFPLVVFSHGGLGIGHSNLSLYRELASHGYVVGSIEHPYHALWTRDVHGRITWLSWEYFGELRREDARSDKEQSYRYYQGWMDTRMGDIDFVLDTVLAYAAKEAAGVYRFVDPARIGVIGHSLGGAAALGIGRQRSDVRAVISLEAPFLYDIVGVEDGEFVWIDEGYPVPVLNVYSDSAWGYLAEWPQYARNAALLSDPQADVVNVHIGGAGHLGLTDLVLSSRFLVRLLDGLPAPRDGVEHLHRINRLCLEFLSTFMEHDHGR